MKIIKKLDNCYWACYRFIRDYIFEPVWYRVFGHKHHIVRTGLNPSPWYDTDTRMLYAVMSLVENFVENDMVPWSKKGRKEELERIDKEESEYKEKEKIILNEQWANEDGIKNIYKWWKNYPNRQKEIKVALSKWHDYISGFQKDKDDFAEFFTIVRNAMNKEQKKEEKKLSKRLHDLEKKLANEEQEMLKKAVELRLAMWS